MGTLVVNEGMSFNIMVGEAFKNCEVLGVFKDTKNNKKYIIYTDYEKDKYDNYPIYGALIEKDGDYYKIMDIDNENVIKVMNAVLSKSTDALR